MKSFSRFLIPVGAVLLAVGFFLAYSFLPLTVHGKYSSPDEASNAYFSKLYADSSALWVFDQMTIPTGGLVHPRSVRVAEDFLVPGGFLGLPVLFGIVGRMLGMAVVPFLTPLIGLLAALAWGALITARFGKRLGAIAGVLLLVQPAWWYETSRTMQPNVLFCSLVIFSAYFFFAKPFRTMLEKSGDEGHRLLRGSDAAIAGILIAAALSVRASEAYWLLLGIAVAAFAAPKRTPWKRLAVFAIFAAVSFAPYLLLNNATYGSPTATGYGSGVTVISAGVATQGFGNRLLGPVGPYLFPLGFAPRTALVHFWTYGVAFFWWWTLLVAAGIWAFRAERKNQAGERRADARTFCFVAAAVALWLILFYGSYIAQDNPDPNAVTIGTSYLRYWLPAMVLSTLPVAWLLNSVGEKLAAKQRCAALAVMLVLIGSASACAVFNGRGEGLLAVRGAITNDSAIAADVIKQTPEKAIIITDFDDKYLWPERHVLVPLRSEVTYGWLQKLQQRSAGLYYFGLTLPDKDFAYLRDVKLAPQKLAPVVVKSYGAKTLYEFKPL